MPASTAAVPEQGSTPRGAPAQPTSTSPTPAAVLAAATRSAAATQTGLAPLLADAAVATTLKGLPEPVRQAALRLLSFPLPADTAVTADQLRRAFARSGIFLEASLEAAGKTPTPGIAGRSAPGGDLKAALVALRAVLVQAGGSPRLAEPAGQGAASTADAASPGGLAGALSASVGRAATTDAQGLYRVLLQATGEAGGALLAQSGGPPPATVPTGVKALPFADNRPPPPYRGAQPAAQPPAHPSIAATEPLDKVVRTLLTETDGALARQTLLQAASLPDQAGTTAGTQKSDAATQRWAFEIPFATPQGPAVAQFEIAQDAHGRGQDRVAPTWRARFAIDIEPLGPVHAQVAVMGERAAVTLWAERAESAALMRDSVQVLAEDLRAAELEPLEVTVRDGTPRLQAPAAAPAGRFLDCAS